MMGVQSHWESRLAHSQEFLEFVAGYPALMAIGNTPAVRLDLDTGDEVLSHFERSDVCQAPPACVVGEAMVALVIADAFMEKFGGDSIPETRRNFEGYIKTVGPRKVYR